MNLIEIDGTIINVDHIVKIESSDLKIYLHGFNTPISIDTDKYNWLLGLINSDRIYTNPEPAE